MLHPYIHTEIFLCWLGAEGILIPGAGEQTYELTEEGWRVLVMLEATRPSALRASFTRVDNSTVVRGRDDFDGRLVGGGVEQALGDHFSARLEYRYSDLSGSGKFDRDQVLAGVTYHF